MQLNRSTDSKTAARVLVVDDEADVRTLTALIVEGWGYAVQTADSADDALRMCGEAEFDVVVTDIGMEGVDGFELARRLRALSACAELAIVAVTGRDADLARVRSDLDLFDAYLVKPVEPRDLRSTLESVLA